jgi:hypothetical protein
MTEITVTVIVITVTVSWLTCHLTSATVWGGAGGGSVGSKMYRAMVERSFDILIEKGNIVIVDTMIHRNGALMIHHVFHIQQ